MASPRYVMDSTKRTLARYPGPWDVVMDTTTGHAVALCPHHAHHFYQGGAFSLAPAIADFLNAASDAGATLGAGFLNKPDQPNIRGKGFSL